MYWFYDGYAKEDRVIQANGSTPLSAVTWNTFLNGNNYRGSKELDTLITETDRELLVYYGLWNVGAQYTIWPGWSANSPNGTWQCENGGVCGTFRCDWFVNEVTEFALGECFDNKDIPPGGSYFGFGPVPKDLYESTNARAVSITTPTATVDFLGQSSQSIVIDFSELMSRGTLDPDWNNTVTLTGTVNGQNITYPLSSADVLFQGNLLPTSIYDHGDEIFDYPETVWNAEACQYRSVTQQSAQQMIITPVGGFTPGETLCLTISGDAKDLGGNAFLGKSFTLQVPSLEDGATLTNKTIADNTVVSAGQHFTQSWTLQNTGTTTWTTGTTGYTLNRISGDPLQSGLQWLTLSDTVLPNGYYTFSLDLIAPTSPGTYTESWQMYGADSSGGYGTSFGPVVTVQIVVPGTPTNHRPLVGVVTPSGTLSGDIAINYSLFDDESDTCSIQVQYSPNGGTNWYTATQGSGGNGTTGLSSLPLGSPHTYVWASGTDIGSVNNTNVKIRIAASDAGGAGTESTTGAFTVTNQPLAPPELTICDASATEGNSGTVDCTFTVVLSRLASQDVTVQWATADGTATVEDSDYQSASNTLTILAGELTGTIVARVNGDTKHEGDEYFYVNLSNPNGATISRSRGAGTILNDDQPPGNPEIAVEGWFDGTAHDIFNGKGNPEWLYGTYFGTVTQNSTPPTRTFTVQNIGTAPLTTNSLTVPLGFTIIEPLNGTIAAGDSDDFTLQMSTSTVGTQSGKISFGNNDADEDPFHFAISGTVTYVGAAATTTVLDVSPSSAVYGQSVTFTAIVGVNPPGWGVPSGTVTFMVGSNPIGSAALSQGTAVFSTSDLPSGPQVVTAVYSGDGSNYASSTSSIASNLVLSTVAGNGPHGYQGDGGPATAASLGFPNGVAVDIAGNVFIADTSNNVVRKVDHSTGIITTIAGIYGAYGYNGDNIQATAASLGGPSAVAVDGNGNLLIADAGNGRIRMVNLSTGIISTVAGNGNDMPPYFAGDNGPATAASLNSPRGIVIDNSGNIFIADTQNNRVRKVDHATGIITTVAGGGTGDLGDNGLATAASLNGPTGIALDASGNLYIADYWNSRIRKVDHATNLITTVAGNGIAGLGGDGGPATAASLNQPWGVAVDANGHLFIADRNNGRIRQVTLATNTITTIAGGANTFWENGPALAASLSGPCQIAVDASGNIFVAEGGGWRVRKIAAGNMSVNIAPASLLVSADAKSRVYRTSDPSFTATISGFQNGETLETSGVSGSPTLTTSAVATSPVGSYPITASPGTLASTNYTFTFVEGTLDVLPAPLTANIIVGSKTYDGTAAASITGRSVSGVIGSDDVTLTGGTAFFANRTTGTDKDVTVTALVLTGADASNYTVDASVTCHASIIPASLTATVMIGDKTYDGTTSATITGQSLNGVVRSDDVVLMGGDASFIDKNVGVDKAVTTTNLILVGADAGNYTVNSATTTTADITPALLTVTADDKSRRYGKPNPTFTASYAGFKNGETLVTSSVTGSPSLNCDATVMSPVGTYTIVAGMGTLAAQNYDFTFVNGTLTVFPENAPLLPGDANDDGVVNADDAAILAKNWGARYRLLPGDANRSGLVNEDDASVLSAHWGMSGMSWRDGDFNGDGRVNAMDAAILAANWGATSPAVTWSEGDFNGDGVVNAADAAILAANWGATVNSESEPATLEPTIPTAPFVGPIQANPATATRRLIEPTPRAGRGVGSSLASDSLEDNPLLAELSTAARAQDAPTARDIALAEVYGPQIGSATLQRQQLAWSYSLARRNSSTREDRPLAPSMSAIDMLLAMDQA